ncbi:hypothetical protein AAC387_Pa01g0395 [Persea americana]
MLLQQWRIIADSCAKFEQIVGFLCGFGGETLQICVLEKADRLAFWLSVSLTPCSLKSARFPPPSLRSASRLSSA